MTLVGAIAAMLACQDLIQRVADLAWLPDGSQIVAAGPARDVTLLAPRTGKKTKSLGTHEGGGPNCLALELDGKRAVSGGVEGKLIAWDVARGQSIRSWSAHTNGVNAIAFRPGGNLIASAGGDGFVRLWKEDADKAEKEIRVGGAILSIAFNADGSRLAIATEQGEVSLWDVEKGERAADVSKGSDRVACVRFQPKGTLLAWGDAKGVVHLWDPEKGKEAHVFADGFKSPHGGTMMAVSALAFSPDGRMVAAVGAAELRVWDVKSRKHLQSFKEAEPLECLAWDVAGAQIAVANNIGQVRLKRVR